MKVINGVGVSIRGEEKDKDEEYGKDDNFEYTMDGSVDIRGQPAAKGRTGGWIAGWLILGNLFS